MAKMRVGFVPEGVRGVREQFEGWRAVKKPRERIPVALWAAAAKLCQTYSVYRVSRWLRVSHAGLQKRAGRRVKARACGPKPAFVEWDLPGGILPVASSAEYVVELAAGMDGVQRIHVRGAGVAEVAALARALRGAN